MGEVIICLACGGVAEGTPESGEQGCRCGAPASEGAQEGMVSSLRCPDCEREFVRRRYADWVIEECDGCGGVFVESATLGRLLAERERSGHGLRLALPKPSAIAGGSKRPRVRYVKCPVCGTLMTHQNFGRVSGVLVDACVGHGVWFDAGELTAILEFVGQGGLERPRAERQIFAAAEGPAKGSFGVDPDRESYDAVARVFWDALGAIIPGIGRGR